MCCNQGWKNRLFLARQSRFWFNTIKTDLKQNTMVLFGLMSGRILGRFTAGIIVTVVHVVVDDQQVSLNARQFVDSFGLRQFLSFERISPQLRARSTECLWYAVVFHHINRGARRLRET